MATAITIKRYNGSSWDELAPATTIAQVSGLQSALNGKQSTLTFDSTPTQSSTNPVTSGGVYTAINNVTEIANGKTASYVLNVADNSSVFSTANLRLNSILVDVSNYPTFTTVGGGTVNYSSLKIGDIIYLTDTEVPDWWVGARTYTNSTLTSITLYKMETTKVDLTNYQTKVSTMGSTTKPVYVSASGTFSECDTYAGGTAVTLNGTNKSSSTASFYAPTSVGTSGEYLVSNGSGAPSWQSKATSVSSDDSALVTSGAVYDALTHYVEADQDYDNQTELWSAKNRTYLQSSAPTSNLVSGDLLFQTS